MAVPYPGQQTTNAYSVLKRDYIRRRYRDCRNQKQCLYCRTPVTAINPRTGRPYIHCDVHRAQIAATLRRNGKHKRALERARKQRATVPARVSVSPPARSA